jgi:glycosyltransferase involved in cell wall biosynthesis
MNGPVTAVVLSIGEATTEAAIASIRAQSMPVADIVVVRDIRPFYRALNYGASQVKTPFFIQVDADMILDPGCVAALYAGMGRTTAIVVGRLRDPLLGLIVGVKLFRTQPVLDIGFRDTISPDTHFVDELARTGWSTDYVGGHGFGASQTWDSNGEHRPDYSAAYTYRKHLMEGQRYRHRGAIGGFHGHLQRLESSEHPMAFIAEVGLARGFFRQSDVDQLGQAAGENEFARLEPFLIASTEDDGAFGAMPERAPLPSAYASYFELGRNTFSAADGKSFRGFMSALDFDPAGVPPWPLKLALCQGLLAVPDETSDASFGVLQPHLIGRFKDAEETPDRRTTLLDRMLKYAEGECLPRFAVAGPLEGEFARNPGGPSGYSRSEGVVRTYTDARGRPRIALPFALGGHILCPEPKRLDGLAWCIDALSAGYTTAHVPFVKGDSTRDLPALVAQHLYDRFGVARLMPRFKPQRLLRRAKPDATPSAPPPSRPIADFTPLVTARAPTYNVVDGRVLLITEDLGRGGSERQLVAVVEGMVRRRIDITVFCLARIEAGKPSYQAEVERLGASIAYADELMALPDALTDEIPASAIRYPNWMVDRMVPMMAAIRRYRPAVVHAWLDAIGIAAGMAGCLLGVPRTIIQQGSMAVVRRDHPASEAMRRAYLALSTNPSVRIRNNSKAGARDNEVWIGLPGDTIGLIYNGFEPGSARTPAAEELAQLRRAHGLADGVPIIGTAMRFVKEKDPELWIDTAAVIAATRSDVRFLIYGFGPLENAIAERIDRHRLGDRVIMAGPTDDVGLVFSAMDVVLMTSYIEGLPNVMIEAQAVGRPVVAPDVGGTREALIEGVTGLIAPERTARDLARATLEVLDNEAIRRRVRTEGPQFVADRFGLDRMVEETLAFY